MKKALAKSQQEKTLFDKVGVDPFVLVVALVLLFIASVFVFPNFSLSQKFLAANSSSQNNSTLSPTIPPLKSAGLLEYTAQQEVSQGEDALAVACVLDLHAHGVSDEGRLSHCLIEYKEELETRSKTYGDECNSHDECPPSIVWTEDAHHGECPAGSNFKCSLRCTSDGDCSFKTGGVLNSCCFECAQGQPFGFCLQ